MNEDVILSQSSRKQIRNIEKNKTAHVRVQMFHANETAQIKFWCSAPFTNSGRKNKTPSPLRFFAHGSKEGTWAFTQTHRPAQTCCYDAACSRPEWQQTQPQWTCAAVPSELGQAQGLQSPISLTRLDRLRARCLTCQQVCVRTRTGGIQ